jgi:putative ABC transport system permease protein
MSQKMHFVTLIMASIRNKPGRNLATIFCFAFIAANIFSAQYLMAGAAGNAEKGISRMGADSMVVPAQYEVFIKGAQMGPATVNGIVRVEPSNFRVSNNIMDNIRKVPGISDMSPQLFVVTHAIPELSSSPVDIYGIDPDTDFTIRPWLHHPPEKILGPNEVIVGSDIAGEVSSQIVVSCQLYTIAGKLDPTQSSVDHSIFLRMDDAYSLAAYEANASPSFSPVAKGDISAVLVKAGPEADPEMVSARIQQPFPSSYLRVIGRNFALEPVSQEISGLPNLLNMISGVVVLASLPLIALIAAMVAHERQREIGLLMAMGAKRKIIFSLVMAESLVLAAIGGIAGIGTCLFIFSLLNSQVFLNSVLQITFITPQLTRISQMAGLALLVVIAIGSISSLWPAYQSSRMNPYDAIRGNGS